MQLEAGHVCGINERVRFSNATRCRALEWGDVLRWHRAWIGVCARPHRPWPIVGSFAVRPHEIALAPAVELPNL
jgi:hypothetical protein